MNAAAATAYIVAVSSALYYAGNSNTSAPDGLMAPVAFLSLFVLSAGMMVYFFLYQPVQLFFDGKPQEAAKLFSSTLAAFAIITAVTISAAFILSTFAQ